MSVKHDHKHERKTHIMSRLHQHQQPHQEGLALCHRVTLDSVAHPWVPTRTPTVHRYPKGKALGGPTPAPRNDDRQTTARQRQVSSSNVLSETGVVIHLERSPKREINGKMLSNSVNEHVVNKVEVETSRIIKKIAQRNETHHPGEDQPEDQTHQDSPESVH